MTMWYFPPTRRSIEQTVTSSSNGAIVFLTCSGFVNTSKTSSIGASNSRVMTISRSFGNLMTADPCRLGVTAALLVFVALSSSHPPDPVGRSTPARTCPTTRATAEGALVPGGTAGDAGEGFGETLAGERVDAGAG